MNTTHLQSIHTHPGLVDVQWRPHMRAMHIAWRSEFDPSDGFRVAVVTALDFANRNSVENWLIDLTNSETAAKPSDMAWIRSHDMRSAIRATSLRRFALMPPTHYSERDLNWLSDWEEMSVRAYGRGTKAMVSGDMGDIEAFFADRLEGTSYRAVVGD